MKCSVGGGVVDYKPPLWLKTPPCRFSKVYSRKSHFFHGFPHSVANFVPFGGIKITNTYRCHKFRRYWMQIMICLTTRSLLLSHPPMYTYWNKHILIKKKGRRKFSHICLSCWDIHVSNDACIFFHFLEVIASQVKFTHQIFLDGMHYGQNHH